MEQHCNTCRSMLFNTSKLLRWATSSQIPILDKKRSNRFVRIERSKSYRLKAPKKRCNTCSRVAAFLDTFCTLSKLNAQQGPIMTYQTDRIWHAKATPQPNKTLCLTLGFFHSISHWCISKTASTKRYVTVICKWKTATRDYVSACFNTSKLLQEAASSRISILDKERSNRFVRMIWKIQVSPLKSTQKEMQCLQSCCRISWHILHFAQAERSTRSDNDISNWQDLTRKSNHSQTRHLVWLTLFFSSTVKQVLQ